MTKTIDGKRVAFYGKSDREVEAKYQSYLLTEHEPPKPKVRTFDQVADDWWETKSDEIAPGSLRVYRARYKEVRAEFAGVPVNEILPMTIVTYLRKQAAQEFSQKVLNSKKSIIKLILDNALIAGEIVFNPCINLPTVKGKQKVERPPADDADLKLIEAHKTDSLVARMMYFIMYTGCRRGEAAALQAKHINRKAGTAHICQTLTYSSPEPQVKGSPKTAAGVRDVVLLPNVLAVLPEYADPNTFVFFPAGLPREREFQVLIDTYRADAGVSCTPHQLRHSYATLLHSAGVDAKDAQYLLGHSSIVVTQDIYTALDNHAKSKVASQIYDYVQKNKVLSDALSKSAGPHESSI